MDLIALLLVSGNFGIGHPLQVALLEFGVERRRLGARQRLGHDQVAVARKRRPLLSAQTLQFNPTP